MRASCDGLKLVLERSEALFISQTIPKGFVVV
jgi:hypothetical protein